MFETVSAPMQAKVLVTFLENGDINLRALDIDENDTEFETFVDWNDPASTYTTIIKRNCSTKNKIL